MSYTFSATGLPPGLSIVGNRILGTPSTPGNYTATFTVSDGVSSVSNVVSITIAGAAVPIPFWKLILSADCGSYSLDSARAQIQVFAESGSYWRDSAVASPLFVSETGSYWLDSVESAIAETGSYWLDSAVASPLFVAETGSYWLDSVEAAIAETGSYWLDSVEDAATLQAETTSWISRVQALGGQPTTTGQAAVDAFFVAIKSQSYYSKLKLIQLFCGTTTIASAMAPLLHPSNTAATLSGFTGSDYTASGGGAGIQGNGSGYINHNFSLYDNLPGSSAAIGTYSKTGAGYASYDIGHVVSNSERFEISARWSIDFDYFFVDCFDAFNGRLYEPTTDGSGFCIASRVSSVDLRYSVNGTQKGSSTLTTSPMPSGLTSLFSFAGGAGLNVSLRKLALSFAATGMTPTEVSHFSSQGNTLVGTV